MDTGAKTAAGPDIVTTVNHGRGQACGRAARQHARGLPQELHPSALARCYLDTARSIQRWR